MDAAYHKMEEPKNEEKSVASLREDAWTPLQDARLALRVAWWLFMLILGASAWLIFWCVGCDRLPWSVWFFLPYFVVAHLLIRLVNGVPKDWKELENCGPGVVCACSEKDKHRSSITPGEAPSDSSLQESLLGDVPIGAEEAC